MVSRAENSGLLRRLTLGGAVATLPFLLGCVYTNNLEEETKVIAVSEGQVIRVPISKGETTSYANSMKGDYSSDCSNCKYKK